MLKVIHRCALNNYPLFSLIMRTTSDFFVCLFRNRNLLKERQDAELLKFMQDMLDSALCIYVVAGKSKYFIKTKYYLAPNKGKNIMETSQTKHACTCMHVWSGSK